MADELTKQDLDQAGGDLQETEAWKDVSAELRQEKQDKARAVDEFSAYEEIDGIKLYAPTAKHKWALAAFAQTDNSIMNGMIGGYILGTESDNLDKIFVEHKNGTLTGNALNFSSQFDLSVLAETFLHLCNQGSEFEDSDSKN